MWIDSVAHPIVIPKIFHAEFGDEANVARDRKRKQVSFHGLDIDGRYNLRRQS
ncbi:hypothetical protein [Bradyrhizobium sp. JR3.5]